MSDQLLRAHEMMEYVYNVADVAYPVSIRDQMNRARWLVEKAHDLGFFGPIRPTYRKLLVCGAGAAGVTAALHAVGLGVETVLVERSGAPFRRQRLCTSRWIDPTQYDWSADHWTKGLFPHAGPAMPLAWSAERSHRLAIRWHLRLRAALSNPRLTFRRRDRVVGLPVRMLNPTGTDVGVRFSFASHKIEDFGMMLWAIGFGGERRFAPPNYTGFAFWETDPFEQPNWGVPSPPQDLRALVSGAGDGALQDAIRLATGKKSAHDVYRDLLGSHWVMPADVRHQLFTAEDQAQRALMWCQPSSIDEHKALQQLHDAYVDAVDHLINHDPQSATLIAAVNGMLSAVRRPVRLVHPCTHFTRVYSLNHFLVLLLAKVAANHGVAGPTIRDQCGVSRVLGVGHTCPGIPWACHGSNHTVYLEGRPACHRRTVGTAGPETAHVVVIRHGIAPHPAFAGTPMAFARQIMPYHLP
jgi:hypothetical protein